MTWEDCQQVDEWYLILKRTAASMTLLEDCGLDHAGTLSIERSLTSYGIPCNSAATAARRDCRISINWLQSIGIHRWLSRVNKVWGPTFSSRVHVKSQLQRCAPIIPVPEDRKSRFTGIAKPASLANRWALGSGRDPVSNHKVECVRWSHAPVTSLPPNRPTS